MSTDKNEYTVCQAGKERYQLYLTPDTKQLMVQYEYRTETGMLFTCTRLTLDKCREERDMWLNQMN